MAHLLRVARVSVCALLGATIGCSPSSDNGDGSASDDGSAHAGDGAGAGGSSVGGTGGAGTGGHAGDGGIANMGGGGRGGTGGTGTGGHAGTGGVANMGGASGSGGSGTCAPPGITAQSITADLALPAGPNYATASFRLWYPQGIDRIKGIVVLLTGSNGDGRGDVTSSRWQQLANTEKLALLGCFFQDYDQSLIDELYTQAVMGSGQSLLDAITKLSVQTGRCDLAGAPLLLWGFSAGGEFTYDFACFAPDRVIGFVVNKGGFYHPVPATPDAMKIPALMFIGGQDLQRRIDAINTAFTDGRTVGAPWALTVERPLAHDVGDSINLALPFFHAILPLRLPTSGAGPLRAIDQSKGYVGDLDALMISAATATSPANLSRTAWLPDQATATLWKTVVSK